MFKVFQVKMNELNRKRKVTVYLPNNYYFSRKRYPVLYIQDGQNAFFDQSSYSGVSWGFLEYVKKYKLDIIMVAIQCNFEGYKRMDEYGPWKINEELSFQETGEEGNIIGGEGEIYTKWMVETLKPFIDKKFRTIRNDTAIVGSSMGGVISAYASFKYPHVFKKCAALSTAFWFYMDEFKELIESADLKAIERFYFDLGEFEGCGSEEIDQWYVESNDQIYEWIQNRIDSVQYRYFEGAYHNESEWRKRVPLFMNYFYGE